MRNTNSKRTSSYVYNLQTFEQRFNLELYLLLLLYPILLNLEVDSANFSIEMQLRSYSQFSIHFQLLLCHLVLDWRDMVYNFIYLVIPPPTIRVLGILANVFRALIDN